MSVEITNPQLEEQVRPDQRDIAESTLGRYAVQSKENSVYEALKEDFAVDDSKKDWVTLLENETRQGIEEARAELIGMSEDETWRFDQYYDNIGLTGDGSGAGLEAIAGLTEADGTHVKPEDWSWHDWLLDKATDEQLLNFLQWNVHFVRGQQYHPKVVAEVMRQKTAFAGAVEAAVLEGWLSGEALPELETRLPSLYTDIGDGFSTHAKGNGGFHMRGTASVSIAAGQGYGKDNRIEMAVLNVREISFHEYTHALIGEFGWQWLDEAATEHISLALKYGQSEIIDPQKRETDFGVYERERLLLALLLEEGSYPIGADAATYAFSSDYQDKSSFSELIDASWGSPQVLDKIGYKIAAYELEARTQNKSEHEAQEEALRKVMSDLRQQPWVVLGDEVRQTKKDHADVV